MQALSVIIDAAREDEAAAALWDHGTCGVEVKAATQGRVELVAYFEREPDRPDLQRTLLGAELASVPVPEVDWVARFREGFRPFRVGRFLVAPRWDAPAPSPGLLVVDPGRAFGTGTHPTTRMCLRWIAHHAEALAPSWRRTLDYGCGSGVLAIAAALYGARGIDAVDIDAGAVGAARANAAANGASVRCATPGLAQGEYDLVLANILATPLRLLAPLLSAHVAAAGHLVLSGILWRQADELTQAYSPWLHLTVADQDDGWILMHAQRRA